MPCSCTGQFLGKEDVIQVLAGLYPSSQTVGSLLRISWPMICRWKKLAKSEFGEFTLMKNKLNYFSLNAFGKVKNLTNLPTTIRATKLSMFNSAEIILHRHYARGCNLNFLKLMNGLNKLKVCVPGKPFYSTVM